MTALIKKYVAAPLKPHSSSHGICVGACTTMAMNKDITNKEQRQSIGHSTSTSTDIYTRMNPELGIPLSLCLTLWPDVRKIPIPPTMDVLPISADEREDFIDSIYLISFEMYKRGKGMRALLHCATAALLMYYTMYVKDHDVGFKLPKRLVYGVIT